MPEFHPQRRGPCQDALFMTGDKRALRALSDPNLQDVNTQLRGRVSCLEHLLRHVLDRAGAGGLVELVSLAPDLDLSARCILPSHGRPGDEEIRMGLESYLRDLQNATRGMVCM
jgi:hypothetical protein